MGGLPRRARFIQEEKEEAIPVLLLDSGNVFTGKPISEAAIDPTVRKAELILRAMEKMGYRAVAVGEYDLYLGEENIRRLAGSTGIRFLSANVLKGKGKPVFDPFVIVDIGTTRVGVFGLTSRAIDHRLMEERLPGVWVEDPMAAAERLVPELSGKCDLVIALTHIGHPRDRELAQRVEGIDVIVGGRTRTWLKNPAQVGETLIVSGYFQGRAMGRLRLHIEGPVTGWASAQMIQYTRGRIAGEETAADPSAGPSGTLDRLRAELEELESKTRYDGDMISLVPSFADDPEIAGMIADYRRQLREEAGKEPGINEEDDLPVRYVGYLPCLNCHLKRGRFWEETAHAAAIETLQDRGAEADPDCLPCHVTGYFRPGGYTLAAPREELLDVQCESCHGSGSLHASSPELYRMIRIPPASACLTCHTPEQDDDFDYARDRVLVCAEERKAP